MRKTIGKFTIIVDLILQEIRIQYDIKNNPSYYGWDLESKISQWKGIMDLQDLGFNEAEIEEFNQWYLSFI